MQISSAEQLVIDDVFVDLDPVIGAPIVLKVEGLNFGGSIKLKTAVSMLDAAEAAGVLRPGSVIVESSSGNLGVALSVIAAGRGYGFVCVMDPRSSVQNRRHIEATGGRVIVVDELDSNQGFLTSRIDCVRALCAADDRYVWLNQYANSANWLGHYASTAPAIVREYPDLEVLYVGAGTTGTLMGCVRYLRDIGHRARVVAIDSVGSITFPGSGPGTRFIPGLGSSRRPEIFEPAEVGEVVHVHEADSVRMCRELARAGFLFGGSTGTVLAGALRHLAFEEPGGGVRVAVAPDLGERYLDTVYDDDWVAEHYGAGTVARHSGVVPPSSLAAVANGAA
ncbi:2,3-diaminopropionate biosynthesis protein SbnA [Rathayibacter tanaceti]|uniref:2,3-diaminopropionate biosynthesis protein SbnA n=2 Tax=Rathayibacter tanaceti TaxID=1671680 RepID=A0A162GTB7_9MICO|nr:2,3-diaminopropionate biosynthesis protein SbnA [Rathayibacter tanaceti]KZX22308.1 putative siderophore biosynthesis protein SbnA [Rathayibacter tanaceti]QHC56133.1 2,3-diaminopropionate biosynthesis protein SbnA [Rathayibacter tanaceti]TCO36970.1 cysteine synthase A [Rathayibacter tanaceti]